MHKKNKQTNAFINIYIYGNSPLQAPSDQDEAGSSDCPASVVWAELGWTPKIANAGVKLVGYYFPNEARPIYDIWNWILNIEVARPIID